MGKKFAQIAREYIAKRDVIATVIGNHDDFWQTQFKMHVHMMLKSKWQDILDCMSVQDVTNSFVIRHKIQYQPNFKKCQKIKNDMFYSF